MDKKESTETDKRQRVKIPQIVVCEDRKASESPPAKISKLSEVGSLVDSNQADDRKLIKLVRERRLLYARNNMPVASYYTQVKNLWNDVAREMGWSVADVRRKWSHIRNSYSRHLRNEMHGACTSKGRMVSRWYLADELEFLREHMATDMRPSPFPSYAPSFLEMDLNESSNPETIDIKPLISNPWFAMNEMTETKLEPKTPSINNEDSSNSFAFASDENSSYFQFFRGIYNDYQELSSKNQRYFKRKCLELLHKLLDQEESGQTASAFIYNQNNALNLSNSGHGSEDEREIKPSDDGYSILPNN